MKVNSINNNYSPTFKTHISTVGSAVAYPELMEYYPQAEKLAKQSDAFNNPVTALYYKLKETFSMLFTPEVTKRAKELQVADELAENAQKIDLVA